MSIKVWGIWGFFLYKNAIEVYKQRHAADLMWEELMIPFYESRRGEMKPHFLSMHNWILQDRSHQLLHSAQGHPKLGSDPKGCAKQVLTALTKVLQPTEESWQVRMLSTIKKEKKKINIAIASSSSLITLYPSVITSQSICLGNLAENGHTGEVQFFALCLNR